MLGVYDLKPGDLIVWDIKDYDMKPHEQRFHILMVTKVEVVPDPLEPKFRSTRFITVWNVTTDVLKTSDADDFWQFLFRQSKHIKTIREGIEI